MEAVDCALTLVIGQTPASDEEDDNVSDDGGPGA